MYHIRHTGWDLQLAAHLPSASEQCFLLFLGNIRDLLWVKLATEKHRTTARYLSQVVSLTFAKFLLTYCFPCRG